MASSMSSAVRLGQARMMSSRDAPLAMSSRMNSMLIRVPRMHGFPPSTDRSDTMRWNTIAPLVIISLTAAAQIPALHGIHRAFSPRGMRAVCGAAGGVGADAPPVDALEPGLRVARFEDGFVATGLVGVGGGAGGVVPV